VGPNVKGHRRVPAARAGLDHRTGQAGARRWLASACTDPLG
jgi:hypothetical protein